MRVAQIIDCIKIGGAETLQLYFADNISGHDVDLSIVGLGLKSEEFKDRIQETGVDVQIFEGNSLLDFKRFFSLLRFMHAQKFDVVHTHLNYGNILGVFIARLLGVPVVSTLHNEKMRPNRAGKLERFILKWGAHRIIAVGQQVADSHRHWIGDSKLVVIPNAVVKIDPISYDQRLAVRQDLVDDPSLKIFISVGRFTQQKGFPDLVKAFALVNETHPNARLVIVGHGELFDDIQQQVCEAKLEHCIILTGMRYDVPTLLAASDIYVCSSWWEGLPITILEAMSAGLPVIATKVGDIPNVVTKDTGLLVQPHQVQELAQAMQNFLEQPEMVAHYGAETHKYVSENFGIQKWVDRLIALYDEVISEG